jgi:hypothetical protein
MPLDPRFACSNLAEDDRFVIAIKICSTTSLGGKVKLAVPCHQILRHVKEPYSMKEILEGKIHRNFLPHFFLLCC